MLRLSILLPFLLFTVVTHAQNWTELAPVPADGRDDAVAFSLAGKGFLVTGNQGGFSESNKLWMYDPQSDSWSEKAPFPGTARQYAGVFSIDDAAYIVAGISAGGQALKDTWKYDYSTDSWLEVAEFPGDARWSVFNFSLFRKGYIGTGSNGTTLLNDAWSYDPDQNSWTRIDDFPGDLRRESVGFSCLGKGYVGLGYRNINGTGFQNDFYSYNPLNNQWSRVADFPGEGRSYSIAFGLISGGVVGSGQLEDGSFAATFHLYDPIMDVWSGSPALPIQIKGMSAFAIDREMFVLTGITSELERSSRMWKRPCDDLPSPPFVVYPNPGSGPHVIRAGRGFDYAIFDFFGHRVRSGTFGFDGTILIEGLNPGLYNVSISLENDKAIESRLLVVQ